MNCFQKFRWMNKLHVFLQKLLLRRRATSLDKINNYTKKQDTEICRHMCMRSSIYWRWIRSFSSSRSILVTERETVCVRLSLSVAVYACVRVSVCVCMLCQSFLVILLFIYCYTILWFNFLFVHAIQYRAYKLALRSRCAGVSERVSVSWYHYAFCSTLLCSYRMISVFVCSRWNDRCVRVTVYMNELTNSIVCIENHLAAKQL